MATFRAGFSQNLAPGIRFEMFTWLKQHTPEYSQYALVKTSDRAFEDHQILAGFGLAKLKLEGTGITYDDPIQGGTKRITPDTYALAWQVTQEMLEDDQYDKMRNFPKALARSMMEKVETVGIQPLNLGFTTTVTADGATFFNTAHSLLDPSSGSVTTATQANRLNPDAELSVTAIQNALILYENQVNERGMRQVVSPDKLWVPVDLQFTAQRLLQSTFEPDTGNNAINTIQGRLEPRVLHYLSDSNNWFLSSNEGNTLCFVWRKRPVMDNTDDFETKSAKYSIQARFTADVIDYRGWVGSAP